MKKLIITGLLILILATTLYSQIVIKGVALKNISPYTKGDTINVYGYREHPTTLEKYQYLIKGTYDYKYVNTVKIELLNSNLNFWDEVWFYNRGAEITKFGWDESKRDILYENAIEYYSEAKNNSAIYQDDLLYDYIYQLILKIHPAKLIKPTLVDFGVIIIKSNEPNYFSFDNGFIVLTTGLISQTKNEKELIKILTESISHVVLEHNLLNLKQQIKSQRTAEIWGTVATVASSVAMISSNSNYGTNYNIDDALNLGFSVHFLSRSIMESLGANYSREQNHNALKVTNEYMNQLNVDETLSDEEYTKRISGVISYSAWQEYNIMNYAYSMELINRIHQVNIATEKDFLLLSKLYRATSNKTESNLEALKLIKRAKETGLINFIELDKELGMLYLRLNDEINAKDCFLRYKEELYKLGKRGIDISDELEFVNRLL